jgi:hypothetical protein
MAIGALTLASLTLRAAMALYSRGVLPRSGLRAALIVVRSCERAGAVLAVGWRAGSHGWVRGRAGPSRWRLAAPRSGGLKSEGESNCK